MCVSVWRSSTHVVVVGGLDVLYVCLSLSSCLCVSLCLYYLTRDGRDLNAWIPGDRCVDGCASVSLYIWTYIDIDVWRIRTSVAVSSTRQRRLLLFLTEDLSVDDVPHG